MSDGTDRSPGRQSHSLDPFDCREPGRCAVVVVSRLNPVRFDGGDIPSVAGVERRSQLFLTDAVRASIGTIVTEAQHASSHTRRGRPAVTRNTARRSSRGRPAIKLHLEPDPASSARPQHPSAIEGSRRANSSRRPVQGRSQRGDAGVPARSGGGRGLLVRSSISGQLGAGTPRLRSAWRLPEVGRR